MSDRPFPVATPAPDRPITSTDDIARALLSLGIKVDGRIRLRGAFPVDLVASMSPPPEPGDLWIQTDGSTTVAYLQISTAPRVRAKITGVTVEAA